MVISVSSLPTDKAKYHRDRIDESKLVVSSERSLVVMRCAGGSATAMHGQIVHGLARMGHSGGWVIRRRTSWSAGD